MNKVISLENINKFFWEKPGVKLAVLENINLDISAGEFFVFVGPSGCGKSTLLRIMSGLETADSGKVNLVEELSKKDFSFVFQQFALLPWLTVAENIGLGLTNKGLDSLIIKEKINKELEIFGLKKFANDFPKELSGGMRQRTGIARALITEPKVIFMDEPFSELDSFTADELRKELLTIWQNRRPTIIMVTHIIEEALELADRIAVLSSRPGKIEKIIDNHLPRPRQKRTVEFFEMEDQLYKIIKP